MEPNGKASLTIPIGLGGYRGRARDALDEAAAKIAKGWTSAEETDRWLEIFRKAPPLAARYRGQEKYERMYAHAIAALSSLCIRGEGGYTGTKRIPYTTKCGLAMPFFWDTSFTCVGLREFDPVLAQEAILCFTENAGPRGSLPGTLCDSHRAGEGQAPIMSWAAWLTYQRGHDKAVAPPRLSGPGRQPSLLAEVSLHAARPVPVLQRGADRRQRRPLRSDPGQQRATRRCPAGSNRPT